MLTNIYCDNEKPIRTLYIEMYGYEFEIPFHLGEDDEIEVCCKLCGFKHQVQDKLYEWQDIAQEREETS